MIPRPPLSTLFPYTMLFRSSFSLDQRLQVKVRRRGQIQRLDNLVSFTTGGSYNFLWRELGLEHPFSTLGSSMFIDRKSTRLNSSHANISYAVFCLKKKNYTT